MKFIISLQMILIVMSFFLAPYIVKAEDIQYTTLAPIDGYVKSMETIEENGRSFGTYLDNMFKLGIALCTGLAVIMIIVGGIQYVSSDAWSKKSDGKERIIAALFGLLIALGSYALLNTINPNLLNTSLDLEPLTMTDIKVREAPATTPIGESSGGTDAPPGIDPSGVTYADAPGTPFAQGPVGIDFDGSPGAYKVTEVAAGTAGAVKIGDKYYLSSGYENLANAGGPGNWYGVKTDNGKKTGNPIVNPDGTLTGQLSYGGGSINGDTTAFAVLTTQQLSTIKKSNPNFKLGDTILVTNPATKKTVSAIYADNGGTRGANHTEISPAAATALGIQYGKNNGKSYANGTVVYSLPK